MFLKDRSVCENTLLRGGRGAEVGRSISDWRITGPINALCWRVPGQGTKPYLLPYGLLPIDRIVGVLKAVVMSESFFLIRNSSKLGFGIPPSA